MSAPEHVTCSHGEASNLNACTCINTMLLPDTRQDQQKARRAKITLQRATNNESSNQNTARTTFCTVGAHCDPRSETAALEPEPLSRTCTAKSPSQLRTQWRIPMAFSPEPVTHSYNVQPISTCKVAISIHLTCIVPRALANWRQETRGAPTQLNADWLCWGNGRTPRGSQPAYHCVQYMASTLSLIYTGLDLYSCNPSYLRVSLLSCKTQAQAACYQQDDSRAYMDVWNRLVSPLQGLCD